MKPKFVLLAAAVLLTSFLMSFCKDKAPSSTEGSVQEPEAQQATGAKKDCNDVHWTYEKGPKGPENWKNLCDAFADCGGKNQSPIDIITASVQSDQKLTAPQFKYGTTHAHIVHNGHTIQFNVEGDHSVQLNGKDYKLLQFHYHAPSEHTIDGKQFPLEVHFVHKHSDDDLAVIGILFAEGAENPFLTQFLDKFPRQKGQYDADQSIDLLRLFPDNKSYYHYKGSLTTPPCSEIVHWYVLKHPVEASKEQLDQFAKILNNNYRPVQALNDRQVFQYDE